MAWIETVFGRRDAPASRKGLGEIFAAGRTGRVRSCQEHTWRRLSLCLLLGAGCAAFAGNLAQAQEAPVPENEQLPPNLQPSIASSIPVLAGSRKGCSILA